MNVGRGAHEAAIDKEVADDDDTARRVELVSSMIATLGPAGAS